MSKRITGFPITAVISFTLLAGLASITQAKNCPLLGSETGNLEDLTETEIDNLDTCEADAVDILIKELQQPNWQQRAMAAYIMGRMPELAETAVPELINALNDEHPSVRYVIVQTLEEVGSSEAVDGLVKALEDEDESVRASAIMALIQLKAVASSRSTRLSTRLYEVFEQRGIFVIRSPDPSRSLTEQQIVMLSTVLEDGNWSIRNDAVEALIQIGKAQPDSLSLMSLDIHYPSGLVSGLSDVIIRGIGAEPLLIALQSPSADTRRDAAWALGRLQSRQAVPDLLGLLDDPDENVRWRAIEALGTIESTAAVPALIDQMKSDSNLNRIEAAISLSQIGAAHSSPDAVSALIEALSSDIAITAARALGEIGEESAVPALITAMRKDDSNLCDGAAYALAKIGSPTAVGALEQTLQEENWLSRFCVLKAFAYIPKDESSEALILAREQSLPMLVEALQLTYSQLEEANQNAVIGPQYVRAAAASALAMVDTDVVPYLVETIPPEVGVPIMIELLENTSAVGKPLYRETYRVYRRFLGPADGELVDMANLYLEAVGPTIAPRINSALAFELTNSELQPAFQLATYVVDANTLEALTKLLDHPDISVQSAAANTLGHWEVEAAIPILTQLVKDEDEWFSQRAAVALGQIGSEDALPALIEALNHEQYWVRAEVVKALGQIGAESALPTLEHRLKDQDWEVRRNAVLAMGKIGSAAAIPALIAALEDPHFYVNYAATEALAQLGSIAVPALLEVVELPSYSPLLQKALQNYGVQRRRAAVFTLGRILKNSNPDFQSQSIIEGLESVAFNHQEPSEVRRMAITALSGADVVLSTENLEIEPISLDCKADYPYYFQGLDACIHAYAGNCVYEDEFQGGDGFHEIYESLRKLLRRR